MPGKLLLYTQTAPLLLASFLSLTPQLSIHPIHSTQILSYSILNQDLLLKSHVPAEAILGLSSANDDDDNNNTSGATSLSR